jgi:hypothetical protein
MEKPMNLRLAMPNVARCVDEYRQAHGAAFVNECISRGMAGEPNWFYAFEAGHVLGCPFTADAVVDEAVRLAVAIGGRYAMVMRPAGMQEVAQ